MLLMGAAAEAPAMRGMVGDALRSTLHKERATKSREVVLCRRSRRITLVHDIVDVRRC